MDEDIPSWDAIHESMRELAVLAAESLRESLPPSLDQTLANLLREHMDSGFSLLSVDEERLLYVVMIYRLRLPADEIIDSPNVAGLRSGMDSANAIGTVFTRMAKRSKGRKLGAEREAGIKWLTGLRRRHQESELLGAEAGLIDALLTLLPSGPGRPKRRTGSN